MRTITDTPQTRTRFDIEYDDPFNLQLEFQARQDYDSNSIAIELREGRATVPGNP